MELTRSRRFPGLNAYQLKLIAVLFMTIDHIGAYAFEIPFIGAHVSRFRQPGRIAAPLFIFLLTDSIRHTRSKPKFLLRLYLAAVGTGLFTVVTNALFCRSIGFFRQSNIFFSYFYMTLDILLIEGSTAALHKKDWKKGGAYVLLFIGVILMAPLSRAFHGWLFDLLPDTIALEYRICISDLAKVFLPDPLGVEYGPIFTLMGILMYFGKNKYVKTAILLLFSVPFCWMSHEAMSFISSIPYAEVLLPPQCYMFFAAPFMLLYNGERGKNSKWFFYIYYPTHRYAISIIQYLYRLLV